MKNNTKSILIGIAFLSTIQLTQAQTKLTVESNQVQQSGGFLVLENASWINNSTFQSSGGTVLITGDAAGANSTIDGTSSTTFNNLTINKSSNNALLENSTIVSNTLTLTSGNLDLQSNDLTISSSGTISGGSSSSYIKTSSTGVLAQEVGASNVVFPVGNSSYTPVTLNNAGTTDDFNVRVENAVYLDGTSGNTITTDVVNATWYIDEATANGSDVTATFQWNASDELTDFDRTQAFVSNYHTSQWNNGTATSASGSNPYTLTESGITSFSPFIVASGAAALPVELLYFYGEKEGENVRLNWQTVTEINNSHFDVEWSTDGISFAPNSSSVSWKKIGKVAGAGTTDEVQFYEFLHRLDLAGLQDLQSLYYRLRQVDFDGKYEYTNVINITIEQYNNTTINIYPNPASHYLKIESDELIGEMVQIFNINGQLVREFQHESLITNLPITDLPSGTYFVKMGNQVKKIIIQR